MSSHMTHSALLLVTSARACTFTATLNACAPSKTTARAVHEQIHVQPHDHFVLLLGILGKTCDLTTNLNTCALSRLRDACDI